jgi:hypothetical protein
MIPETENVFDLWHVFVCEEVDDLALFDFHILDTFSRTE